MARFVSIETDSGEGFALAVNNIGVM